MTCYLDFRKAFDVFIQILVSFSDHETPKDELLWKVNFRLQLKEMGFLLNYLQKFGESYKE